jgi:D-sedoheptulose 7-phosphate isomerase
MSETSLQVAGDRLREASAVLQETADVCAASIAEAAAILEDALRNGHKVLIFGNGGSASQAEHLAGELVGKFLMRREALAAICLNTSSVILTAVANDEDFSLAFARQVDALGTAGDVAVGLSTSGDSPNVVEGLKRSRSKGLRTVALTGRSGGAVAALVDVCIRVPADSVPRIQEAHLAAGHTICELVEAHLAGGG